MADSDRNRLMVQKCGSADIIPAVSVTWERDRTAAEEQR